MIAIGNMKLREDEKLAIGATFDVPAQFSARCKIDPSMTVERFAQECGHMTVIRVLEILRVIANPSDLTCRHKVELRGRPAKKPLLERMFTEASRDMLKP